MTRTPPALAALDAHGKACPRCIEAARAGLKWTSLCGRGRLLFRCAKREQAGFRRVAS